jgi:polyhydroxyalkanoate synthesis regulator phasin
MSVGSHWSFAKPGENPVTALGQHVNEEFQREAAAVPVTIAAIIVEPTRETVLSPSWVPAFDPHLEPGAVFLAGQWSSVMWSCSPAKLSSATYGRLQTVEDTLFHLPDKVVVQYWGQQNMMRYNPDVGLRPYDSHAVFAQSLAYHQVGFIGAPTELLGKLPAWFTRTQVWRVDLGAPYRDVGPESGERFTPELIRRAKRRMEAYLQNRQRKAEVKEQGPSPIQAAQESLQFKRELEQLQERMSILGAQVNQLLAQTGRAVPPAA